MNSATLCGIIASPYYLCYAMHGERFYKLYLDIKRYSGTVDSIPVVFSEKLTDTFQNETGRMIKVSGDFRSRNRREGERRRLDLFLFADEFQFVDAVPELETSNTIEMECTICKNPSFRLTPKGSEITDLFVAAKRGLRYSSYIPCIAWGKHARFAKHLSIGDKIRVYGRIQSREYQKVIGEERKEIRTTYEVSIGKLEVIDAKSAQENPERIKVYG